MNVPIHTWYISIFLNTWSIHAKLHIWCCWHMFCTSINISWFFLCAAQVAVDVSQQWTQPNEESLLPSRWNDLELAKNKGLDNDDSNGRCLGSWWRCLAWVRCQNHSDKDMIHTMFGGNRNGNDSGWTTLSKVSLLTGAAHFLGGLPVLKHSVVKIAEFLHSQHSDKLIGLQLPRPDQALRFSHVDECSQWNTSSAQRGQHWT